MRRWPTLAVLACLLLSKAAGAVEKESAVGLDVGVTSFVLSGQSARGGMTVGAHYTYGLTDQWNLLAEIDDITFLGSSDPGASLGQRVGVGAAYVLDVMQFVPYGGAMLETTALDGRGIAKPQLFPGVAFEVGLDWRLSRHWSVGAAVREHLFAQVPASTIQESESTDFFLRGSWVFGW